eukprot:CAMPEP_0177632550 /NCGR_PEP_ID=MMETSP0447-20121125/2361_1 /TAXON_ID=0 /ORGANISM="Stygamoeba regulata, Strain BSH-02190019" /LENGTH=207 /DNA_ID=CAMNT_0019134145 /DNA_START=27 /DNA_END=645 /DNA_ORIENTATION=-
MLRFSACRCAPALRPHPAAAPALPHTPARTLQTGKANKPKPKPAKTFNPLRRNPDKTSVNPRRPRLEKTFRSHLQKGDEQAADAAAAIPDVEAGARQAGFSKKKDKDKGKGAQAEADEMVSTEGGEAQFKSFAALANKGKRPPQRPAEEQAMVHALVTALHKRRDALHAHADAWNQAQQELKIAAVAELPADLREAARKQDMTLFPA